MNKEQKKGFAKARRIIRVRAKITGTTERPRLAVRRTISHVYAQVIDDSNGKTIVAASDADVKGKKMTKTEVSMEVGKVLAERAKAKGVEKVVFDRRDKKYHGRVKAVADGARSGGLTF